MAEIVHFNSEDEQLDNSLKLVEPGYYEVDNGRVKSEFHEAGNEVVFINKNRRISWQPENMKYLDEFGAEDVIYSVEDVPLEVKGNYARYNRSMPDVDDWFIQENDRLKHQILIQGFQRDPMPWLSANVEFIIGGKMSFDADLKVMANGTEQRGSFETNGAIELYDGNELIFTLPQIIAFDSNFNRSMTTGKYRVYFDDNADMRFDIILDNEWIASLDRVYPIVIDPTVIVNSGYGTIGTGRKGVELSDGSITTVLLNNITQGLHVYKSIDRGVTFTQLCHITPVNTDYVVRGWAVANKGNEIGILATVDSQKDVLFWKINGSTQQNTNIWSNQVIVDGTPNAVAGCALAYDTVSGKYHAAYSVEIPGYFGKNIGYSSSSDGVNWSLPAQVTFSNSASITNGNVNILVRNGQPIIIYSYNSYAIKAKIFDGSSWGSEINIFELSATTQDGISAALDKNNNIHLIWHGTDSAEPTYFNVRYIKSTDGTTWSTAQKLTSGNLVSRENAVVSIDRNNKIHVVFEDGTLVKRIESNDLGDTWSAPYAVDTGEQPEIIWDPTFQSALVFWFYMTANSVSSDRIVLNSPPNIPANLTRTNYDASDEAEFIWTFSDPDPSDTQSGYQIQIIDALTSQIILDTGKVGGMTTTHSVSANTLTNNKQYKWRVKTWDNIDMESPWSEYKVFYTSAKPSVSITNVTEGQNYVFSSLTLEWTMSDPESEGQSSYQIELLSSTNQVLWDSGKVIDSRSRSRTLSYTLENDTSYKLRVTVWDAKDVKSESANVSFNVAYTAPPIPIVEAAAASGHIVLTITNPVEEENQPLNTGNDIYKLIDNEWVRIAKDTSFQYRDFAVKSGEVYEYKVRAKGNNGTYSDSDIVLSSTTFSGVWLHKVADPEGSVYQFKFDGRGRSSNWEPEHSLMKFAGRKHPVMETGVFEQEGVSFALDLISVEATEALKNIVKSREMVCYRDGRGRMVVGVFTSFPLTDERYGHSVSLEINQIDYREGV